MKIYFFLGKGGVGKTTASASWSVGLARSGIKTLVASIDPAHNLADAFDTNIGDKPTQIGENLAGVEVNIEQMIRDYLEELSSKMKNTYRYLSTMNIDRYFDILKNSPGIEEYATMEAIKKFIALKDYEAVVFDTPPTGMTIRVLAMPKVSLVWTDQLIKMRRRILKTRGMVENVQGKFEAEVDGELVVLSSEEKEDPIMQELLAYREELKALRDMFSSDNTFVNIVTMPEDLALLETKRIMESLEQFKIKVRTIFLNKFFEMENPPEEILGKIEEQKNVLSKMKSEFRGTTIKNVPLMRRSPRGVEKLFFVYSEYLV
ncbi:MAG: ArsA family ATPase [Caldisericaceae bacterium]